MQIKQEVLAEPEQFIGQTRSLANNEFDLEGALTMISSLLAQLNLAQHQNLRRCTTLHVMRVKTKRVTTILQKFENAYLFSDP